MVVIGYNECPACGKDAELDNGLIQEKITYQEKKQRIATRKMIRKVIPLGINYWVMFPQKVSELDDADLICQHCGYYERNWGWTYERTCKYKSKVKKRYDIYIPRKTFFLPRDEFLDTIVHELTHALIWEDRHGQGWYFQYRDNRKIFFRKFSRFIKAKNILPTKLKKEHAIYLSDYEHEYDEYEKEQKK